MTALDPAQAAAWTEAQALWGVEMHPPRLVPDAQEASFAWFTFPPQVFVDLAEARRDGVDGQLTSIFAHEIGHHVLSPSTRATGLKITQQMARAVAVSSAETRPDLPDVARRLGNLWSDMLINVRVARRQAQRRPDVEPEMVGLWRRLAARPARTLSWWVVLRAYELLWSLPDGTLARDRPRAPAPAVVTADADGPPPDPALDAELLAETVRTFAADPVSGALRWGMVMAAYLDRPVPVAGCGGEADPSPPTADELTEVLRDPRLQQRPVHPALVAAGRADQVSPSGPAGSGPGQGYGLADTLALWASAEPSVVVRAWYEAEARRWVRPLRAPAPAGAVTTELPGALEVWEVDEDPVTIDWPATLVVGPRVVPGVTTRRRTTLPDEPEARLAGIELDLYVDSSGSMQRPEHESPVVLAGTIVVGSVLRAGGRVRVTSFSGAGEVSGTTGFTRRGEDAMAALLTFFGGGTTFPLDLLARRYLGAPRSVPGRPEPRRHLLVLSDDGLASMFGEGQEAYAHVAAEVARRLDTATLMVQDRYRTIAEQAAAAGYAVSYVDAMADAPAACARLAATIVAGPPATGPGTTGLPTTRREVRRG